MMDAPAANSAVTCDDDQSILHGIAAGDRSAFERLMRVHNRRLYRLARATLRDDAEAEDALQDAYLRAFRSIAQFRGDAALSTWLSKLVINECLSRMRRNSRRQNVIPMVSTGSQSEFLSICADDSEPLDTALARRQVRSLLERKIDELPDSYRTVFVMRAVEEMTVDETAESLGIPEETVRSRHFRAKSLLRESLAQDFDLAERDVFEFGGARCDRIVATVMARAHRDELLSLRGRFLTPLIKS